MAGQALLVRVAVSPHLSQPRIRRPTWTFQGHKSMTAATTTAAAGIITAHTTGTAGCCPPNGECGALSWALTALRAAAAAPSTVPAGPAGPTPSTAGR